MFTSTYPRPYRFIIMNCDTCMKQLRFELNKANVYEYKLNPATRISGNDTAGKAQKLRDKDSWFDPTVRHYFSPITIRLLVYVFKAGDRQPE